MLVLLDRDGVINVEREGYITSPHQLALIDGAAEAIKQLNHAGHSIAVVTNQSVVGRSMISSAELDTIHTHLKGLLAEAGAKIDAIYVCEDHPDQATNRRKPGAGMLIEAMRDFKVAAENTVMVGDDIRDMEAAMAANVSRYMVKTGKGAAHIQNGLPAHIQPVAIADNLAEAVKEMLADAA